ncbi:MAG: ABC transporter permease [Clostridia bacterium]|nr:ABC transporter permease [Clostridia bacterium]
MTKYLLRRLLHGLISVVIVVAVVMLLIYSLTDREKIFGNDPMFTKKSSNVREMYKYEQWEKYGYIDYVTYNEYLISLVREGQITEEERAKAVEIAPTAETYTDDAGNQRAELFADKDSPEASKYIHQFVEYYESKGYTVVRLNADYYSARTKKLNNGGKQALFTYKDVPLVSRLLKYFGNLFTVDNIHYVDEEIDIGERKLTFTLHDPAYTDPETGEIPFSPAIMGNGTRHKYLVYTDGNFPFIHQNLLTIRMGTSYSVNKGVDVFETMTMSQGKYVKSVITYPTGLVEESADDLHSATYSDGSVELSETISNRFNDNYTNVNTVKASKSKIGFSFVIGIISVALAYVFGIPFGILMAKQKDKLLDKIGTIYIIFIIAVPSLAYIFMFQAIGRSMGLPALMDVNNESWKMYILPIISLALPSIAGLMRWLRRYMIDQMNSDYVRFARSGGLSEGEIFTKHILKNAAIPIIHGVPGAVLGSLVGAIITERVYLVPGAGNLLTNAINANDNGVIVGMTLFYAILSITSLILGDILMATVDPRISFTSKAR